WSQVSVTNLNKARKLRARKASKARADQNAVAFGRTREEKALDKAQRVQADAKLDDHKRTR
ncbi:unnamed protein product, partial [Ectocarpus sp. 12 AP-2014]